MKRIISLVLALMMITACIATSSASSELIENECQITDLAVPQYARNKNTSVFDLQPTNSEDIDEYVQRLSSVKTEPLQLDAVSAMQLETLSDLMMRQEVKPAIEGNQAPVANPILQPLNPEVQIDGEYTTESRFFLFTRINDQELCYDPDGDTIELAWIEKDMPRGYITKVSQPAYDGYLIHIFNKGTYPFVFAFYDSFNELSPLLSFEFNIRGRADCQIINGDLSTEGQVDIHPVVLDFSEIENYNFIFLNIGGSACKLEVLDENNKVISSVSNDDPACFQNIKRWLSIPRPEGLTDNIVTYSLRVTRKTNDSNGDFRYQIIYGDNRQKDYFTEDVSNAIDLPYYHSIRDYDHAKEPEYQDFSVLTNFGQYYYIETIGSERVTLVSQPLKYNFKILDSKTMELLFDSARSLVHYKPAEDSPINIIGGNINFPAGGSYYLVVYNSPEMPHEGKYSIMVGEPKRYTTSFKVTIPETSCVKGTPKTWSFDLAPYIGEDAYVNFVTYFVSDLDWLLSPERIHYRVKTPGKTTWDSAYMYKIDYQYENTNVPLTQANGKWYFQIIPGKTGTLPSEEFTVYYYFDA